MKLPTALGAGGAGIFSLAVIVGWFGFPKLLRSQIAANMALKKGSELRNMWENFTEPIDFRVYIFNITNPEGIHRGEKPAVQEVGPYFYDEYKVKVNLQDHMEDDSVSYNPKVSWFFNPSKSNGLTGDEVVTVVHPLMLGMTMAVERERPGMLGLVNKAFPHIYNNPTTMFLTAPVRNILFEGVIVNCTVKDFSAKALCTAMKKEGKDLEWISDTVFKFSFFGGKNGSHDPTRMRVKRGINDIAELGKMVSVNGKEKQSVWSGDPCNLIRGTDSTIFPPFQNKEDDIVAFAPDLCFSLGANFEKETEYKGIHGNRYTANLGDMMNDPDKKCFCPKPDLCMKKGAIDMGPCQGAPIVITLPHFYLASEDYLRSVIGLSPIQEKHEIYMTFEPITATPLGARKRLQFNLWLHPVPKMTLLQNVPEAMVPIFWVEEGLELDDKYIDALQSTLFRTLNIVDGLKWTLMAVGGAMGVGGIGLYMKRKNALVVTPERTAETTKANGQPIHIHSAERY